MIRRMDDGRNGHVRLELVLAGRRHSLHHTQIVRLKEYVVDAFGETDGVVGERMIFVGGFDVQRLAQGKVSERFLGIYSAIKRVKGFL